MLRVRTNFGKRALAVPKAGISFADWRPSALSGPTRRDVQATETTKSGLRGEYEESRKPACRECRCFGCTCGDLSLCALPNRTQGCGSSKRPAFPAPSLARDDDFD